MTIRKNESYKKAEKNRLFLLDMCSSLSIKGCSEGDDHLTHPCSDGGEGILYLGNHTSADGSVGTIALEVGLVDRRNHAVVIIWVAEHSFLLETEGEGHIVIGSQRFGSLTGDGVGIGVEDTTGSPVTVVKRMYAFKLMMDNGHFD